MRRQGPVTLRHLAIAVLVVVVVNAQLTWWIIFAIGQSRTVLDLERNRLTEVCRFEAVRVRWAVAGAEAAVAIITSSPDWGSSTLWALRLDADGELRSALPPPFERWALDGELSGRSGWHDGSPGGLIFELPCPYGAGVCGLVVSPSWAEDVLEMGDEVELEQLGVDRGSCPEAILPAPFADLAVRPRADLWDDLLAEHRRRVMMMVSEGSFFAVLLVVLIGMMWRTVRREVELERQHRNFLSAITHELKSPLAAIRLSLETIVRGRADETASRRFVANALTDTDRLERLVTKVLEATRFGAGTASIRLDRGCLSDVVERTVATFEPRAAAAGAALHSELAADVWAMIDSEAMAIAVSNLLENALKYGGKPAEVHVVLRAVDGDATIDVRDNGSGVPEAEIPFIFDRFYRAGDEMTRTSQGTGLGLYLVQKIVKAHHGRVAVAATGSGSTTFRVTLPEVEGGEDPR